MKNPDVILEACRIAGIKAVMVGPYKIDDANKTWKGSDFGWYLPPHEILSHPNAVFVGQLAAKEVRDAMSGASMFINSSNFESFGLAVYEAAAAGLPLCLPNLGTFDSFRRCALFHEPRDAEGLANNMKHYIKNKKKGNTFSSAARKVAKKLDYPELLKEYKSFYDEFSKK